MSLWNTFKKTIGVGSSIAGGILPIVMPGSGTVIGSGLSTFGNWMQGEQNQKANMQAIEAYNQGQIALADRQAEHNVSFWNMQNEYNTPEKQMERYISAGLNPNLIYGQINSGNAASVAPYSMPGQQAKSIHANRTDPSINLGIQSMAADVASKKADVRLKEAQVARTEADTKLLGERYNSQQYDTAIKKVLSEQNARVWDILSNAADFEKGIISSEIDLPISRVEAQRIQNSISNINLLVLQYFYDHGSHEQKLRSQQLMNSLYGTDLAIKREQLHYWRQGLNPNTSSYFEKLLNDVLDPYIRNHRDDIDGAINQVFDKLVGDDGNSFTDRWDAYGNSGVTVGHLGIRNLISRLKYSLSNN